MILPTFGEALALYRDQVLAARNLALRTRHEYANDLRELVTYLEGKAGLTRPDQVRLKHLEGYLSALDARGLKGSTRRRRYASIRSFFDFLIMQGLLLTNPTQNLIPPQRAEGLPRTLSEREYKRLLEVVRFEPRDAAILELFLQTGIRRSELCGLTLRDIELPARITKDEGNVGRVTVKGKGSKTRTVTLNWKACKAVKAYLAVRPRTDDPHLFITKFGRGIGPRSVDNLALKYLREAGIYDATLHALRHTFGTQQHKRGTKLDTIRKAMGHTSLKTTSIYIDLAREEMDKELQANAL